MNAEHTKNPKIGIIGFGHLGRQIKLFLSEQKKLQEIDWFFFDDKQSVTSSVQNIYPFSYYENDRFRDLTFYVGLGYHHLVARHKIIKNLTRLGRAVETFIHQTAYVHATAKIGSGALIFPGCIVDQNVIIGDGCILNNAAVISHGSQIGSAAFFAPRVTLCGETQVGEYSFLGAGTLISNGVLVGKNVRTGIGTVVVKHVGDGESMIGNPGRRLSKPLNIL